jgi:hypothetical protein
MKACTRPPKNRAANDARVISPATHLTTSSRSKVYSVSSFVLIHAILILSNCVILNFGAAPPGRIGKLVQREFVPVIATGDEAVYRNHA